MSNIIILNKPFQVLSQFTTDDNKRTLAHYIKQKGYYPAGRLDYDSEGMLILTNDGKVQNHIASPKFKMPKTYWVQVEGEINDTQLQQLMQGLDLKDGRTKPCQAQRIDNKIGIQQLWSRQPPIRERKHIPTNWLSITLKEGKNRQVRRMTAVVGLPALRLIRMSIGHWQIDDLLPGQYKLAQLNLPKSMQKRSIKKTL